MNFSFLLAQIPSATSANETNAPGNFFSKFAGGRFNEIAFGKITWAQFILSGAAIIGALVVVLVLRSFLKWKIRTASHQSSTPEKPTAHSWWHLMFQKVWPPVIAFVWIWGIYVAARILLSPWHADKNFQVVFTALHVVRQVACIVVLFWFIFRLIHVVEAQLKSFTAKTQKKWDDVLVAVAMRAARLALPLLAAICVLPLLHIPNDYFQPLKQIASLLFIAAIGFILYELVATAEEAVQDQYRIDVKDNLATRKVQTQVKMLKKIAVVFIALFTVAVMLMEFDSVRKVGASLLTSAGIAGVVIGFAAQKSLATLVAGIQIAFSQPIRIDDVVIVEGEWGRIEEITMTYVVVVIWDLRRMVLPITYFIEKPFQNWTRVNANLLGSVFLYLDYTVPVQAIRDELDKILAASKIWDGKVKAVQMTDAKDSVVEIRILVSAADAGSTFDLRCNVREKLVDFLQNNYPQALPRFRAEMNVPTEKKSARVSASAKKPEMETNLAPPLDENPDAAKSGESNS